MSKIQINELNLNASEFNALNREETAEVVGGYYYYYPGYSYYSYSDNDYAEVNQHNLNGTQQVSFGSYYYGNTGNSNSTGQSNNASIYQ